MTKLTARRRLPYFECSSEAFELSLGAIAERFTSEWLDRSHGTHLLQKLWARRDSLASTELSVFGDALVCARSVNERWLNGLVETVRKPDENNQRGAAFEILSSSFLSANQQKVSAPPRNQKGFDLFVESTSGLRWQFSLKAHGRSQAERAFRKRMDGLRSEFIEAAQGRLAPTQLAVQLDRYPLEADWQLLRVAVMRLIGDCVSSGIRERELTFGRLWLKRLAPNPGQIFAHSRLSYTVTAWCKFHSGEEKGFADKLEAAIGNLAKHVGSAPGLRRTVFMRMPSTISLGALTKVAADVFSSSHRVESAVFMQPYWACPKGEDQPRIFVYGCDVACAGGESPELARISVPFGEVVSSPPEFQLSSTRDSIALDSHYWYQRGEHYYALTLIDGKSSVSISVKEPGIRCMALLRDSLEVPPVVAIFGHGLLLLGE